MSHAWGIATLGGWLLLPEGRNVSGAAKIRGHFQEPMTRIAVCGGFWGGDPDFRLLGGLQPPKPQSLTPEHPLWCSHETLEDYVPKKNKASHGPSTQPNFLNPKNPRTREFESLWSLLGRLETLKPKSHNPNPYNLN